MDNDAVLRNVKAHEQFTDRRGRDVSIKVASDTDAGHDAAEALLNKLADAGYLNRRRY